MAKAARKKLQTVSMTPPAMPIPAQRPLYTAAPWVARHRNDHSEIEAYVEAVGNWTVLTAVSDAEGVDAEATADFIIRAVNAYDLNRALIGELAASLRSCLDKGTGNWQTAYDAEIAIRKAEQLIR
jgi:hypothetical protein